MSNSNVKRIRVKLSFTRQHGDQLVSRAAAVGDGVPAHPEVFPAAPVDGPTLKAQTAAYVAAYAAALEDGGKKAMAERFRQESALTETLRKLAHYVEIACNQNMDTFLLSGFEAVSTSPSPSKPPAQPVIVKVTPSASRQMVVSFSSVGKVVKQYRLRYVAAPLPGSAQAEPTTMLLANAKPVAISNLMPGTNYTFQVCAWNGLGFSDWSDPMTRMCT
jgi:hypothetical protein